ncbi:MAG: hypothetical protein ABEH43_01620, partial [Flavobacteriales bacterium]
KSEIRFKIRTDNDDIKTAIEIENNRNVGIGVIDPNHKLDVAGTVRACEVLVENFIGVIMYLKKIMI